MTEQQFGRYQIIRELGRGGMATVYLAHDPRLERDVALKVLPREFLHDPEFLDRFKREARTAALDHMAIVPVYDFGEADGQPFIVMKLMAGGSLEQRIGEGMQLSTVLPILDRLAQALDYAHSKGVIHRDLKPGNVLFDETGNAFLSDFGIARAMESGTGMTRGVIGTPFYMSPEQINGSALDGRSDQYALAVLAFQLLTGTRPFDGDTAQSLFKQHLLDTAPLVQHFQPSLPGSLDAPLQRALAKAPADRFTSCAAFVAALANAARQTQLAALAPVTLVDTGQPMPMMPKPTQPSHVRNLPVLLAVGGGAVALVLVGLVVGGVVLAGNLLGTASTDPNLTAAVQSQGNPATSTPEPPTATVEPSATPPPTATEPPPSPTRDQIAAEYVDPTGVEMVGVPAGEFAMGSNSLAGASPAHTVYLDAFFIDRTEVTNQMYAACVSAGGCEAPRHSYANEIRDYYGNSQYANWPVVWVDWYDAAAYCRWRDGRLPTEAEWEKAARGTDGRDYPWGNFAPSASLANYNRFPYEVTAVASYPAGASPFGALDMAGNAWEWVADVFVEGYGVAGGQLRTNPTGPTSGSERAVRGGSSAAPAESITTFYREGLEPGLDGAAIGFRCARSP